MPMPWSLLRRPRCSPGSRLPRPRGASEHLGEEVHGLPVHVAHQCLERLGRGRREPDLFRRRRQARAAAAGDSHAARLELAHESSCEAALGVPDVPALGGVAVAGKGSGARDLVGRKGILPARPPPVLHEVAGASDDVALDPRHPCLPDAASRPEAGRPERQRARVAAGSCDGRVAPAEDEDVSCDQPPDKGRPHHRGRDFVAWVEAVEQSHRQEQLLVGRRRPLDLGLVRVEDLGAGRDEHSCRLVLKELVDPGLPWGPGQRGGRERDGREEAQRHDE
jgi:hypothetical protein